MFVFFRPRFYDFQHVPLDPDWGHLDARVLNVSDARDRYQTLVSDWKRILGLTHVVPSDKVDLEDWVESATRLVAAVATGMSVAIPTERAPGGQTTIQQVIGSEIDFSDPAIFIGSPFKMDSVLHLPPFGTRPDNLMWPLAGRLDAGGSYWSNPILMDALGRPAALATGDASGSNGYIEATRRVVESGARSVLAKIVFQQKYMPPTDIPLTRLADGSFDLSEKAISRAYIDALDFTLVHGEELSEAYLIQERRDLGSEYRIFVVDGKPIAGAGTVEWLCPLLHDPKDGVFDPIVERYRSDHTPVRDEALVRRYVERARDLCDRLRQSGSAEFDACTMDFALDGASGDVVLIETNPVINAGLYATDPAIIMAALVETYLHPAVRSPTLSC